MRYRVSVCKGKDCRRGRSDDLFREAQAEAARLGLGEGSLDLGRGGCYGLCHLGPNVVVREDGDGMDDPLWPGHYRLLRIPGEVHYWRMDGPRLRRVLEEHVRGDRPARDLACPDDPPPARKAGTAPGSRHRLGRADLAEGEMRGYRLPEDRYVCLVRLGGALLALDDQCNHAGCLLSGGRLEDGAVVCPCHEMTFDVRTGALTTRPRLCDDQATYRVDVVDGEIWVDLG